MITYRKYDQYLDYEKHQAKKANFNQVKKRMDTKEITQAFVKEFQSIIEYIDSCRTVLCLGARYGNEVLALRSMGFNAMGMDVNPSHAPKGTVHRGDFHGMEYGDSLYDMVYTNSLDHCLDISKVINEMRRVKKKVVVIRYARISKEGNNYESCFWDSPGDIRDAVTISGMKIVCDEPSAMKGQNIMVTR